MSDPIRINRIENKPLKVKAMAPVIRDTTPDYEGHILSHHLQQVMLCCKRATRECGKMSLLNEQH